MHLRPLQLSDWKGLHRLCTDPRVAEWLDEVPLQPAEVFRRRLEQLEPATTLALAAEEEGELVGALWMQVSPVRRRAHSASLWLAVLPAWQRKGIGAALLDAAIAASERWFNLVRLEGDLDPDNLPALSLLDGRGFEVESRKRLSRWRDGRRCDLVSLGRLRADARSGSEAAGQPGLPSAMPVRPAQRVEVKIRAPRLDDAEDLARIAGEPSVMWGTMQLPFPVVAVWKSRLEGNLLAPDHRHVLIAEVDDRPVGLLGMFGTPSPRSCKVYHLGMSVHTDLQGAGIGHQLMSAGVDLAHRWLGAWRLELEVYVDNLRAIALYEKHGFVREGIKRCDAWRDGGVVDSLIMAKLFG